MIDYLALAVALSVSSVSAYYSIIGLTAIFSASFWPIVVMGGVLEAGKLVTASWLYRNWKETSVFIRSYLTCAVVVLMLITSMGIFGFLSKAHIDQQLSMTTGNAEKIQIIDEKIKLERESIDDLDKQIAQIDSAVTKMTDKGQAQSSLNAADKQRKVRDELTAKKTTHLEAVSSLRQERLPLVSIIQKMEADVGPIKYIAQLIYSDAGSDNLERAVRAVILLLVIVFDPLAVVLLIAANSGLSKRKKEEVVVEKKRLTKKPKRVNVLKIDDNNVTRFIEE
jgi:hypothetical protein